MNNDNRCVDIASWEARYRSQTADLSGVPANRLVERIAAPLTPGEALDLARGTGRNALWLAAKGWDVSADDGAPTAIDFVKRTAKQLGLTLHAEVKNLQAADFSLPQAEYDLVLACYYLQRNLFARLRECVKPGGLALVIAHTTEEEELPTESRLRPGELTEYFRGWELMHTYEGLPDDPEHRRRVAEVVARKPVNGN